MEPCARLTLCLSFAPVAFWTDVRLPTIKRNSYVKARQTRPLPKARASCEAISNYFRVGIFSLICSMHERATKSCVTDFPMSGAVLPLDQHLSLNSKRSLLDGTGRIFAYFKGMPMPRVSEGWQNDIDLLFLDPKCSSNGSRAMPSTTRL
jgi:hypothetical protein